MWVFVILMCLSAAAYAPIYWAATPVLRRYIGPRLVLSFVILILAGTIAPPGIYHLLCVAVMVFTTKDRVDAVCRFVLLGALIPSVPYPLGVGDTYLILYTALDALGVGLLLATMLKPDRSQVAKARGFAVEDAVVLLLFAAIYICAIRMTDGMNGLLRQTISGILTFLLPYFLIRRNLRTVDEYRVAIGCLAAAAAILSVIALYEAGHGWPLFHVIDGRLGEANGDERFLMIRGGTMRASASMSGALMLACYLSIGWVAILCSRDLVKSKAVWIIGCVLILAGELAAQSRGNLLCVALSVPILLAAHRRFGLAAIVTVCVAATAEAVILAAQSSKRIASFLNMSPDRVSGEDYDYRQLLLRRGLEEAAKHRWMGTDLKAITSQLEDIRQGQGIIDFVNTYLFMYLVAGMFVTGLIIIMIAVIVMRLIAIRPRMKFKLMSLQSFTLATLVSVLIGLSFMSFIDRVPVLVVIALTASRLCCQNSVNRALRPAKKPT